MDKEKQVIEFTAMCMVQDDLWFFAKEYNGLFCMNIETKKVNCKGILLRENIDDNILISDMKYYDGKIYMIPFRANNIYIYTIKTGVFENILIRKDIKPYSKVIYNPALKFVTSVIYNNSLYLIPRTYPAIIEYNLLDGKIHYYEEWLRLINPYIETEKIFFKNDVYIKDDIITLFSYNSNFVMEFDTTMKEFRVFASDKYLENPYMEKVIKDKHLKSSDFKCLLFTEDYVYYIFYKEPRFLRLDIKNRIWEDVKSVDSMGNDNIGVYCAWIHKKKVYLYNAQSNMIEEYDSDNILRRRFKVEIGKEKLHNMLQSYLLKKYYVEKPFFSLREYINWLQNEEFIKNKEN